MRLDRDGRRFYVVETMQNSNNETYDENRLVDVVIDNYENVESTKSEQQELQSASSLSWADEFDDTSDPTYDSIQPKEFAGNEMDDFEETFKSTYCNVDTDEVAAEKKKIFTDKNDRYEIKDSHEIAVDVDGDEKSKMLKKQWKKRAINGYDLINARNNPGEIPEYIILRHARKDVFKTFEDIHCKNEKTLLIQFPTCVKNVFGRDNPKLRSLWFWRILSLFLAIIIAVVYINTSPPVHHVYHRYHKKKFYNYILFFLL
ncbi:GfV-B19-ORF1 [Ichnoviriform fumiferanae]|uniref:GfV-B19-ORF1 n=1 Tax=Ichnoviriform fumiferanae TaxID=419435 RepID=A2PZR7_9VIRU|nr:GfV-B19-ORF1 [Ichnoviriform fumiferanae]BAF45489.1 GfV-B19-ORF1 [Ichnoviriform fumiferanae]